MIPGIMAGFPRGASDPYFANVALLCHMDGTDGQSTMVDSSSNAVALTSSGAVLSTASPKFGTASLDLAASAATAYVYAADSELWNFGAGQFTVEAFVYFTSAPGGGVLGVVTQFGGNSNLGWFFGPVAGELAFYYSTNGADNPKVGSFWAPTLNTWYHIAADRDASNVLRVYINGAVHASATVAATFYNSTRSLLIGNDENFTRKFPGRIDEVRITKGVARYAGAFTPPSGPFP